MSGLDPLGRTLFKEIFKNLKNSGKTIFFSTHILQDIESLCESVVVLSRGRLYHQGSVTELLSRGLMGTDIRVAALPTELVAVLENLGCKCHSAENSSWNIFVPLGTNLAACQKLLCEKSVLVELLAPRHQSLENVLYAKN
jgi:ABC-type multidrug transport system ATPase subunit